MGRSWGNGVAAQCSQGLGGKRRSDALNLSSYEIAIFSADRCYQHMRMLASSMVA